MLISIIEITAVIIVIIGFINEDKVIEIENKVSKKMKKFLKKC